MKLGEAAARELGGRYPADGPAILGGDAPPQKAALSPPTPTDPSTGSGSTRAESRVEARPVRRSASREGGSAEASWPPGLEWLRPGIKRGNSNNWVVAGRKTKSGRAILANDPHLPIEFPSVWYELHLVAAGLDVSGVTIPGVPFVVLGHNARVAWGITNTGADVQDLFLERIDVGKKRVLSSGQWVPVDVTPADIPVRGRSQPYRFEVWKTKNGPIFADTGLEWDAPPSWLSPDGRPAGERATRVRHSLGCRRRFGGLVRSTQPRP